MYPLDFQPRWEGSTFSKEETNGFALCRHIRTNGCRCQSPSVNGQTWCFFHKHLHRRHGLRPTEATRGYLIPGQHIELTALEDRESVQVALSVVINALATGQLDTRRATAILYGLQLASNNAATIQTEPYASAIVQTTETDSEGLPPLRTRHRRDPPLRPARKRK